MRRLLLILALAASAYATDPDFAPHTGISAPYAASASTEFSGSFVAAKAFDGGLSTGQYWVSTAPAAWLKLDIGSGNTKKLTSYAIQVNTINEPNRAPKDWTMEGSNDNSTWATLDTVTGSTAWGNGESRSFTCDTATTYYRYFRLNITANNTDGLTQVGELYLYGVDVPAIASISPQDGARGGTTTVAVTGNSGTTFTTGVSVVTVSGSGVTAAAPTVASTSSLTVDLTIAAGAVLTARDITVTTGSEVVTLSGSFTVRDPDFAPHTMSGASTPSPYVVTESTVFSLSYGWRSFDGGIGFLEYWAGTNAGVDWVKIDLGAGNTKFLTGYKIDPRIYTDPMTRLPKNWTMEGSNDGSTWATLDTATNETGWVYGVQRIYVCDTATTAYRYFKFNISANNGDATYTEFGEMYLYGTTTPASHPRFTAAIQ